jgi:hypothetical protein
VSTQELIELWGRVLPLPAPPQRQFALWREMHAADTVRHGILETAKKHAKLGTMTEDHAIRFASKCMNQFPR